MSWPSKIVSSVNGQATHYTSPEYEEGRSGIESQSCQKATDVILSREKQLRTQTGSEITFKHRVHCSNHCHEFIISSPKPSFRNWLLLTVLFNIIGFVLELHNKDTRVMVVLILLLVIFLGLKLHFKVKEESLLVMGSIGVQLTTTFASGRSIDKFYDISRVRNIIINEGITMHRVIFYLALLLHKDSHSRALIEVVPLFQKTWPSLSCLTEIYRGTQSVLKKS